MKAWMITARIKFIKKNEQTMMMTMQKVADTAETSESRRLFIMLPQSSRLIITKIDSNADGRLLKLVIP